MQRIEKSVVNGAATSSTKSGNTENSTAVKPGTSGKTPSANPLFAIGYIKNRTSWLNELNALLEDTGRVLDMADVIKIVKESGFHNRNIHGYHQESNGAPVEDKNAHYKLICTGLTTKNGQPIVGWFTKGKKGYEGISWDTLQNFIYTVSTSKKFRIGDFYFDEWNQGLAFLEDLAQNTIPEIWSYQHTTSFMKHPILKSYIENIFNRLKHETRNGARDKIIFSQNGKWMMFNCNLLDKYFHEVLIVAEVRNIGGKKIFLNPQRSKNISDRRNKTFNHDDVAMPPKFFENVNEVVFQTKWCVDRDFDKFTHIIEERGNRFPKEYRDKKSEELARKLDNAIDYAVTITQRNYKFVVPMYRPQTDSIQLLMPIYLEGTYQQCPDFALVLTPNVQEEIYTPETILPLDAAYQNARLIAKPDEAWLNPVNI